MNKYNPNIHHRKSIRLKGYDYSQAGMYFITICVQNRACLFGDVVNGEMVLNDAGRIADECWLNIPVHFPNVILHEYIIMPNHVHGIIELVGAKNLSPHNDTPHDDSSENDTPHNDTPHDDSSHDDTPHNESPHDDSPGQHLSMNSPPELTMTGSFDEMKIGAENDSDSFGAKYDSDGYGAKDFSPLRSPSKTVGSIVRGFKIGVTKWFRSNGNMENIWQRNYWEHIIRDEKSLQRISEYINNNPINWNTDKFYNK
ncbi:MAG: hypothetical protein IT214_03250 [Chitinophagaceae bacterium]|jgi:REP element-mobilizing transposase RayT|nr:hypothetical protein [Chitinophagaceae bacterium]